MIDKIRMNTVLDNPIPIENLSSWKHKNIYQEKYIYHYNQLTFCYLPQTRRLVIKGRLVCLKEINNRIDNLDKHLIGSASLSVKQIHCKDAAGQREIKYYLESYNLDLYSLISDLNNKFKELLGIDVNVSKFKVTYIELCFNVHTRYVEEYITLFNLIFKQKGSERHKNFVIEWNEKLNQTVYHEYESFHVKGSKQFDENRNYGSVINFYNKYNQLQKLINAHRGRHASDEIEPQWFKELSRAKDILRLEVQCHFGELKRVSDRYGIENETREFEEFLDIDICKDIVSRKYKYHIGSKLCDFYNYENAIKIIEETTNLSVVCKKNLKEYVLNMVRNKTNDSSHFNKKLKELGIFYYLIPTVWKIDCLESPMKLLNRRVEQIKEEHKETLNNKKAFDLDASYNNSIVEEDDETVSVTYINGSNFNK